MVFSPVASLAHLFVDPLERSTQVSTKPSSATYNPPSACRTNPRACFMQLMTDGVALVAAFSLLVYVLDGALPPVGRVLNFYALYVAITFSLKWLDVEFQDQIPRVAGFQIGNKIFTALASQ